MSGSVSTISNILQHFKVNNIAVLLKPAPKPITETGKIERVRAFYVLALVHPDTKSGKHGVATAP